ncbi:hypothetical protein PInf_015884 [Phytophthora infestans]|nr:hypothetical protein PInf_015884 [Phytophthora infestans]
MRTCAVRRPEMFTDVRQEVRLQLQHRSVLDRVTPLPVISQEVYDGLRESYIGDKTALTIIPCSAAVSIVKHTHQDSSDGDVFKTIATEPLCCVSDVERPGNGAKKEAERYIRLIDDIKHGRQSASHHAPRVQGGNPGLI